MAAAAPLPATYTAPSQWTDDELVSLLLCRDEVAWAEFLHRYRQLIYGCILKIGEKLEPDLTQDDLDDIYAETLVALLRDDLRKLRTYDPGRGTRLSSWIGIIAMNATYDFLRSPRWRSLPDFPVEVNEDEDETGPRVPTPLDTMLEKERWSHLNHMLSTLSDKDQLLVELLYSRGLEASTVAARMAISPTTVYSKKHKIRQYLRRCARQAGSAGALCDLAA